MDVLKNKQYKTYEKISRYSSFPYFYNSNDNKYIYGTTAKLRNDTPYSLYMVVKGDTPDSIALNFYNNPTYYWVILDFNRIQDPFEELTPGKYIKIPNFSLIEFDK